MSAPDKSPVGLAVARAAKTLGRAFDRALAEAGGSRSVWLILLTLKKQPGTTQRGLATELDLREATVTHHLNAMEQSGLVVRRRDPANRRIHQISLTEDGEAAFRRLRDTAVAFDQQLRAGIPERRIDDLTSTLRRLAENVDDDLA